MLISSERGIAEYNRTRHHERPDSSRRQTRKNRGRAALIAALAAAAAATPVVDQAAANATRSESAYTRLFSPSLDEITSPKRASKEMSQYVRDRALRLEYTIGNTANFCSGFTMNDFDVLVTAAHCVKNQDLPEGVGPLVDLKKSSQSTAQTAADFATSNNDIAVGNIFDSERVGVGEMQDSVGYRHTTLSDGMPKTGTRFYTAGFPGGSEKAESTELVFIGSESDTLGFFAIPEQSDGTTAEIIGGDSGSIVIDQNQTHIFIMSAVNSREDAGILSNHFGVDLPADTEVVSANLLTPQLFQEFLAHVG